MVAPTRTRLVKIGKSKGVRIPQRMLDRVGLSTEVELAATAGRIVIRSVNTARRPRQGWKRSFKRMATLGDDRLLDVPLRVATRWDETEWQW